MKWLPFVLIITMLFTTMSTVKAAENQVYVSTFDELQKACETGDVNIVFSDNITTTKALVLESPDHNDRHVSIDLNGYTYTYNPGESVYVENDISISPFVVLKLFSSSAKGYIKTQNLGVPTIMENGGKLYMENIEMTSETSSASTMLLNYYGAYEVDNELLFYNSQAKMRNCTFNFISNTENGYYLRRPSTLSNGAGIAAWHVDSYIIYNKGSLDMDGCNITCQLKHDLERSQGFEIRGVYNKADAESEAYTLIINNSEITMPEYNQCVYIETGSTMLSNTRLLKTQEADDYLYKEYVGINQIIPFNIYTAEGAYPYICLDNVTVKSKGVEYLIPGSNVSFERFGRKCNANIEQIGEDEIVFNKRDNEHYSYIKGYNDGTFKPDNPVTREQILQMMYSLDNAVAHTFETFPDISSGRWSIKPIAYAKTNEWIIGNPDGNFYPENTVTYAEICKILSAYKGYTVADAEGHWGQKYINIINKKFDTEVFDPDYKMTRRDVVKLINKIEGITPDKAAIDAMDNPFTDIDKTDPDYYDIVDATLTRIKSDNK